MLHPPSSGLSGPFRQAQATAGQNDHDAVEEAVATTPGRDQQPSRLDKGPSWCSPEADPNSKIQVQEIDCPRRLGGCVKMPARKTGLKLPPVGKLWETAQNTRLRSLT